MCGVGHYLYYPETELFCSADKVTCVYLHGYVGLCCNYKTYWYKPNTTLCPTVIPENLFIAHLTNDLVSGNNKLDEYQRVSILAK